MVTMTAEHWRAAYVATLCQITNASPEEAEAEADRILATIDPPIPDDLDVIAHVGTAERAALDTANKWAFDESQGVLFEEPEPNVDDIPEEPSP